MTLRVARAGIIKISLFGQLLAFFFLSLCKDKATTSVHRLPAL